MNRLVEYSTVMLNVPFKERLTRTVEVFDARVLAIVGPTVALEPLERLASLGLPERVTDALLSFRDGQTLVGLKGLLVPRHDAGDVRFTVAPGAQLRRRSATRIKVALPVTLRRVGTRNEFKGTTVDLSADGVLVETAFEGVIGDLVGVSIRLGRDSAPIESTAHVVRCGSSLTALQFDKQDRVARSQLGSFVVEFNRAVIHRHGASYEEVDF